MQNFSKLISFLCIISIVLGVAACGKISVPVPPEGSDYPHSYPRR